MRRERDSSPTRRSSDLTGWERGGAGRAAKPGQARGGHSEAGGRSRPGTHPPRALSCTPGRRSEEHTSELQSQSNIVCRLLLEKKNHALIALHKNKEQHS